MFDFALPDLTQNIIYKISFKIDNQHELTAASLEICFIKYH